MAKVEAVPQSRSPVNPSHSPEFWSRGPLCCLRSPAILRLCDSLRPSACREPGLSAPGPIRSSMMQPPPRQN